MVRLVALAALTGCASACSDTGSASPSEDADASGGGTGGGRDAGADAAVDDGDTDAGLNLPRFLSDTGLYEDISGDRIASGVRAYQPRWQLWSDSADKRRWLRLPEGDAIDTSDMNFWRFPVGTQVWKEFTRGSVRVETRLLEKTASSTWEMVAYQWNDAQTEAEARPEGVANASDTPHDIPSTAQCDICHGAMNGDVVTSVSALMLSHDGPGLMLTSLIAEDRLSDPPPGDFELPGSDVAVRAMGYLHANCGICHNRTAEIFTTIDMRLWQDVEQLGSIEETTVWQTAVGQAQSTGGADRIAPGNADFSAVVARMNTRGLIGMPPLGTEDVDSDGIGAVRGWIESLSSDGGVPDAGDGG